MHKFRYKKPCMALVAAVVLVGITWLTGSVVAQREWGKQIARFEQVSPVYSQSVETGTSVEDLGLPDTLRAVLTWDPDRECVLQEADPGTLAEEYGYQLVASQVEPAPVGEDTAEKQETEQGLAPSQEPEATAEQAQHLTQYVYTDNQGYPQYRVYGSVNGSENRWFAVDEQGNILGVVEDVAVTWACETYDAQQAGAYQFQAQAPDYSYTLEAPYAQIMVEARVDIGPATQPDIPEGGQDTELAQQTLEAVADGVTFTVSGRIPEQAQLVVTKQELGTDEVQSLLADQLTESETLGSYAAYDITILMDGEEWQPQEPIQVSVDQAVLAGAQATEIQVAHIPDHSQPSNAHVDTTVQGERAVFETDGFSLYVFYTVNYTVDFHYNDITYQMKGGSSMLLSQLFVELGVEKNAADVESAVFSNPTLLAVEQKEGDWQLLSLKPFQTTETLTLTFYDGSMEVIRVTDVAYIGNVTVNAISANTLQDAWQSSGVTVTTWPGSIVNAAINNSNKTTNLSPGGTVSNPGYPAGTTLCHATYWNALKVNGVLYDVDVFIKTKVGFFYPFAFGLTLNTEKGVTYLRSFIRNHTSGSYNKEWQANYPKGWQFLEVTLEFYQAGSNRTVKATLPSLAYGNACWSASTTGELEMFNFQEYGYGLYSTKPSSFFYSSYGGWSAKAPMAFTDTLWSYAVGVPSLTIAQYKDTSSSGAGGSGLELLLGTSTTATSANLSLTKTVGKGSDWGSETFTFTTQASDASGNPNKSFALTSTSNSMALADTSTTKTLSNYTKANFNVAGTYYALITEKAGTNTRWKYDTTKWLAIIVVGQNKTTLALSISSITYKNLSTAATNTSAASFTNYYTSALSTSVSATKTVSSTAASASSSFTFNVAQSNSSGTATPSSTWSLTNTSKTGTFSKGSASFTFGTATFTAPGTYYGVISETVGSAQGWTYDTSKWLVTFQVTRNAADYSLSVTKTYKKVGTSTTSTAADFVNYYTPPVTAAISVEKTVDNQSDDPNISGTFTFVAQQSNASGTPTASTAWTLTNASKTQSFQTGKTSFELGTATFPKAGNYYALVTESSNHTELGWDNDTTQWLVTFQVTLNGDYSLSVNKTYQNLTTKETNQQHAAFVNVYRHLAQLTIAKVVDNYADIGTATASKDQDFMIQLEGDGQTTGVALAHGETSGVMTVSSKSAGVRYDIREIVPMEYALTDIEVTDISQHSQQAPVLELQRDSQGNITGGTLTIYPENVLTITVHNTFAHTGYFKGRAQVDTVFSGGAATTRFGPMYAVR